MDRFWLFDWLEEFGINSRKRVQEALRDKTLEADLLARARKIHSCRNEEKKSSPNSILVGRGLDFSHNSLQCPRIECRKLQVNDLFSLVWHYFDRIVVADEYTPRLAHIEQSRLPAELRKMLSPFLELLLYLKQIGADTIIAFEQKPSILAKEYERLAKLTHLEALLDQEKELIEVYKRDYFPTIKKMGPSFKVSFTYQDGSGQSFEFEEKFSKTEAIEIAAQRCVRYNIAALASDVRAAEQLHLPLGGAAVPQNLLLSRFAAVNEAQVALAIDLPVLKNLSAADLIHIRQENADAFRQFRLTLKTAINEKLRVKPTSDSSALAQEIEEDLIKPGLDEIARRLKIAEAAVNKKAFIAVGFGTLATVCGVIAGAGPATAVAAGVATTTALAGKGSMDYVDAESNIESHNLFFLWKALRHPHK